MDCTLVRAYREAARIRRDLDNHHAWLQGMYFYNALCCVVPALNAFKPKKPKNYPEAPYEFKSQQEENTEAQTARQDRQDAKAKTMLEIFALNFNQRFKQKGGDDNSKRGDAGS